MSMIVQSYRNEMQIQKHLPNGFENADIASLRGSMVQTPFIERERLCVRTHVTVPGIAGIT